MATNQAHIRGFNRTRASKEFLWKKFDSLPLHIKERYWYLPRNVWPPDLTACTPENFAANDERYAQTLEKTWGKDHPAVQDFKERQFTSLFDDLDL